MNFFRHMIWSFLWIIVVGFMYAIPGQDLPSISLWDVLNFDKAAHFLVFLILTTTLIVGLRKQQRFSYIKRNGVNIAAIFALVYGGILELMQGWVFIERTSDWLDYFANTVGILFGMLFYHILYGKKN